MKKILTIIVLVACICTSCCHSSNHTSDNQISDTDMFVTVCEESVPGKTIIIFYDKDTKVMYMITYDGHIEMMRDADGSPKLYNN